MIYHLALTQWVILHVPVGEPGSNTGFTEHVVAARVLGGTNYFSRVQKTFKQKGGNINHNDIAKW